jgi:hypothetical protein
MKWIEIKMRELRVSNHPDFKITCFLDCRCMIPVKTDKRGGPPINYPSSDILESEIHCLSRQNEVVGYLTHCSSFWVVLPIIAEKRNMGDGMGFVSIMTEKRGHMQ